MEKDLNIDYIKIDSVLVDYEGEGHKVPRILVLDNAIRNIEVTDFGNRYSTFKICRPERYEDVTVETNKLDETFNAIYDTLHTLLWDVEYDEETNLD